MSEVLGDEMVDGQCKPEIVKGVFSQMNLTSPRAEDPMAWSPMNPAVLELAEAEVGQLMDDVQWLKAQLAGADANKLVSLNGMLQQLTALKLEGLSQRNWWKAVTFVTATMRSFCVQRRARRKMKPPYRLVVAMTTCAFRAICRCSYV